MIEVKKDRVVTIRYIIQNSRGDVLENRMDGPRASFIQGFSSIRKTLQDQLEGMQAGERKQVFLFREDDGADDDFIFDVLVT